MSLCKEITTTTTTKQLRWFNLTYILHVLTAVGTGRYVPRIALESNGKTEKQLQQINYRLQKKQGSSDKYLSFSALFFYLRYFRHLLGPQFTYSIPVSHVCPRTPILSASSSTLFFIPLTIVICY